MWTNEQKARYARQLVLSSWGEEGQEKLSRSSVLVVGCGGLGSGALYYLVAAGVGNIKIIDGDTVELSNLNRQILHSTDDLGRPKTESAMEKLRALNPDCNIEARRQKIALRQAEEIFREFDIVLDCTDGFDNKYMLNDASTSTGVPLVHAGVLAWGGQVFVVLPGKGPCLRCVFPSPPPDAGVSDGSTVGILGVAAGMAGIIQAAEAMKFLIGKGEGLIGRMIAFDVFSMRFGRMNISRDEKCSACGKYEG